MGLGSYKSISLPKQQCVVTHTILKTEIVVLADSRVTNAPSLKMLFPQKNFAPYFRKNKTYLNIDLLRIGQVVSVSCKTVYQCLRQIAVS